MLTINPSDVIAALQACKAQIIAIVIALVIAIVLSVAVKKQAKAMKKFFRAQTWICFLLVVVVALNIVVTGPMNTMVALALGGGQISDESIEESQKTCLEIAEEGMVLLRNEENTLPMAAGKINVFGWSSTNPVYGGTGSGAVSEAYDKVDVIESLTDAGFEVNKELVDFYTNYSAVRPTVGMFGQDWTICEPSMDDYNAAGIFESAKEFSDTAVIFIARSGGEGADLPMSLNGAEDTFSDDGSGMFGATGVRYSSNQEDLDPSKHYLELTTREEAMVKQVTSDYSNVVVVINAANTMELGFLEEYPSIKAAIWTAGAGQTGFEALGEILTGKVNPSGRTVDTYVRDLTKTPWYNNVGSFLYTNADQFKVEGSQFSPEAIPNFVNYAEGIYVGYKFYETAYAETQAGNMNYDYDAMVQYPFGYGLSYTTFTQEMGEISNDGTTVSFDVTVTNTGSVAGKDVVEVYYNPPYTNGGIEKSAVNLVEFAKTGVIEPGASETVSISFDLEDMASFDVNGKGCYVLEAGDYEISVNADAHTKLDSDVVNVAAEVVYDESNKRASDAEAATTKMEDADPANNDAVVLSRADGFANYEEATAAPTDFEMSEEQLASFVNMSNCFMGYTQDEGAQMPTTDAKNGLTLSDMVGVPYDDEKWELLLDQLSTQDMDSLVANGGYSTPAIASVGDPGTTDCDGPASINNNFTGASSIGYPAATMIAATWNKELAHAFGKGIGKMADEMNVSGWYAPAMNIHRSAFAGRNFEYYSEDEYISGIMALEAAKGAYEYKVYPYFKHFVMNDQETNRTSMLCTYLDEQTAREIYMNAFEIAVKGSVESGICGALMSSFNYIGTTWAGAYAPVQKEILRGEWGFDGMVLTDYFGGYGYMNATQAIYNGTDIMLSPMDIGINHPSLESASDVIAARTAAHDILYTVANSRAIIDVGGLANWVKVVIAVDVVMALILIGLEALAIMNYKKRKEANTVTVEATDAQ